MGPEGLIKRWGIAQLYHFTDTANLDSIRKHGGLYSLESIEKHGIVVPRPGGNDLSHNLDTPRGLHRFVHLSLREQHPMRYRAETEGRIGPVTELKIYPSVLAMPGVRFTVDVSNKTDVEVLEFDEWCGRMDFEAVYTYLDWRDPQVNARVQRAAKAEVLVPDHIPTELIRGL